jgi:hypothetical protein
VYLLWAGLRPCHMTVKAKPFNADANSLPLRDKSILRVGDKLWVYESTVYTFIPGGSHGAVCTCVESNSSENLNLNGSFTNCGGVQWCGRPERMRM